MGQMTDASAGDVRHAGPMSSRASFRRSILVAVVLSAGLTVATAAPAAAAPANDNFANSVLLSGTSGSVNGTNVGATRQTGAGEPDHAGTQGGASVWYRWSAPVSGVYTWDTCTSSFDTVLAIYTGSAVGALTEVASNDDGCGAFGGSKVTFSATGGTLYQIAVDGYDTASTSRGTFTLVWTHLTPPPNDNFAQAQVLTGPSGRVSGTDVGASKEPGEPDHAGQPGGASVWYSWTAPYDGKATFNTCASSFDTVLAAYTGDAPLDTLTEVASDDDSCGSNGGSRIVFDATAATTYHIAVDGLDATGTFDLAWGEARPHKVSDFDGDGTDDIAVYRPSNGAWYDPGLPNTFWGGNAGDIPVPGDYNGDGTTDMAIFRPSTGAWYVLGGASIYWGASGDIPVPGDYNGDGTTDIAVYRPSNGAWYVQGRPNVFWGGNADDIPVPGDYNGDGTTDVAIFRPSTGAWYVLGGASSYWGASGDIPVPADYNGDGTTDLAVYRPSNGAWYVPGLTNTYWGGSAGDIPVPADYDGNGVTDLTIFRPSSGAWYVLGGTTTYWGAQNDVAVAVAPAIRLRFFP
jgi:hypothetical protein